MFWKKFCIRYYPPGLALCYKNSAGEDQIQHIDLFDLNDKNDIDEITRKLISTEILLSFEIYTPLKNALTKLQNKLKEPVKKKYYIYKTINSQILPLTNIAFDRNGYRCLSGSYDRTCKIISTTNGTEINCLRGHDNVVFSVGFNYPKCDKIITGSFDKSIRVWNPNGMCLNAYYGHKAEVVSAEFHPINDVFVSSSMDYTARIFHVDSGQEIGVLDRHFGEVIAARYNRFGDLILTGSFDGTAIIWDTRQRECVEILSGHKAELSNCIWNFSSSLIATSSLDGSVRIWDSRMLGKCLHVITDNENEILDITFNYTGKLISTASTDCTAKVYDVNGHLSLISTMLGHSDEVTKVCFSPAGNLLMTASGDKCARLWFTETGVCSQVLSGHESEVFSCGFSYNGDVIVTASKDNTLKIWR